MIIDLVPDGPLDAFLTVGLVVLLNILNNTAKTRMQNEKYHGKHDRTSLSTFPEGGTFCTNK